MDNTLQVLRYRIPGLNLDNIIDARIDGRYVILITENGEIPLPLTNESLDIYWTVKLRNRRKAFGI